jgi:hypothetical protein
MRRELSMSRAARVRLIVNLHDNLRYHSQQVLQDRVPGTEHYYLYQYIMLDGGVVHTLTYTVHDNPETGRLEVVWLVDGA